MNSIQSSNPTLQQNAPNTTTEPSISFASQPHSHPVALTQALMSTNAQWALDQIEAQPNGHQQLLALLARNGIADNTLYMQSHHEADVHYGQSVSLPGGESANLIVRARLNEQAQYDIVGIDLHIPTSGKTESIYLSGAPAVIARENSSPNMSTRQALPPTHLAAHYSPNQLMNAMVRQSAQNYSAAPLPFGRSARTQSMAFSQPGSVVDGSLTNSSGPSRARTARNAHNRYYPASSQSGATSSQSSGVSLASNPRKLARDDEIMAQLKKPDGTLRRRDDVIKALHDEGLAASASRVNPVRQAAGASLVRPSASEEEIREHIRNPDGTVRPRHEVAALLRNSGRGVRNDRLNRLLKEVRGERPASKPSASDEQIRTHMRNPNGTFRSNKEIVSYLHAHDVGASLIRISRLLDTERLRELS